MSPNVGNFVHDLVEMAKAMETLPGVQADLDQAKSLIDQQAEHIQRLEMKLMERSAEIDKLHSDVRSAEVARDDAELRFLEADDHIAAFRRLVSGFSADTVSLLKAIDPPKPEPVVETKPEPVYPSWSEHTTAFGADPNAIRVEVHPTAEPSPIQTDAGPVPVTPEVATSTGGAGEGGERATDPTSASSMGNQSISAHLTVENTASVSGEGITNEAQPNPGVSVEPTPTSAPAPATGTGTEPAAYGSDEEPTKHEWVNGIKQIRQAWFDWYDRQPYEFKQHYNWDAA